MKCSLRTVVLVGTLAFFGAAFSRASEPALPNILLIMSDEHNASVLGCYGNKIVRTPNLDRLAAQGVVFESCYCSSPLCVPSRLAFTAGKYVSRVSAWNNNCRLPADIPSLPRVMNGAGYESFLCGKMHYDARYRYGFTEIGGNMNGATMTGHGNRRDPDDLTPKSGYSQRFHEFATAETSSPMKHDKAVTKGVLEFLSKRKRSDKPFFLLAGYLTPHFPLVVPESYWKQYQDKVPMPVIPDGFLDRLPLNYQHLRVGFHMENVPPDVVKKGRELYYGLTEWTDDQVGQVLKALGSSELASNTVVIYTADHGENMGEHGLWWKNAVYDSAARVPLIISWPARWAGGQRRVDACSHLDLVQTIAAIGAGKVPSDWNGDSMVPWLDRPETKWKDRAVTEYYAHLIASGYSMLRSGRYKYVYHTPADAAHPAQRELYDLKADPGEFTNLANDPSKKELLAQLHAALVKEVGEDPGQTELRCRKEIAKGYPDANGTEGGKKKKGKKKRQRSVE